MLQEGSPTCSLTGHDHTGVQGESGKLQAGFWHREQSLGLVSTCTGTFLMLLKIPEHPPQAGWGLSQHPHTNGELLVLCGYSAPVVSGKDVSQDGVSRAGLPCTARLRHFREGCSPCLPSFEVKTLERGGTPEPSPTALN